MESLLKINSVENFVFNIRNKLVMLDFDLANLYGYEVKRLNEQVKRNIERFPKDFMFQLTYEETQILKSQIATASSRMPIKCGHGGTRSLPFAFTEQGVYMLSTILKSETAIRQSIYIMRAFREMRQFITTNGYMLERVKSVELKQLEHEREIKQIWTYIGSRRPSQQKIFYRGKIYDAYSFLCNVIRSAKEGIILIDNYVDEVTLDLLSKKQKDIKITIFTSKKGNRISKVALDKFNLQYSQLSIKLTDKFHDRFIIVDNKKLYHIGASLKDAGNKCFAISLINDPLFIENVLSIN